MHRRDRRHTDKKGRESQNDIKKLRRENEQLRREIWSLRDEYDKLEDILKSQGNREGSEEYEERSEAEGKDDDEEVEECSDYSDENEEAVEEDCDEEKKDATEFNKTDSDGENDQDEEGLENAENQKISSEKMNSSNHRLHVEFDDLSVVDEEEELKKDRKDIALTNHLGNAKAARETDSLRINLRNGHQCLSPRFASSGTSGSTNHYYSDCPFVFPNPIGTEFKDMLPIEASTMLMTQCPGLYDDSFPSSVNYDSPVSANVPINYQENRQIDQMTYGNQVGWQSNVFAPSANFTTSDNYKTETMSGQTMRAASSIHSPEQSEYSCRSASTARATGLQRGMTTNDNRSNTTGRMVNPIVDNSILPSLLQSKNLIARQPMGFYQETMIPTLMGGSGIQAPSSNKMTHDNWDFGNPVLFCNANNRENGQDEETERRETDKMVMELENLKPFDDSTIHTGGTDRPKHFFAPLPTKIQHVDSGDKLTMRMTNPSDSPSTMLFENFGTGKSSGSDRTTSTVISGRHFRPHGQSNEEIFMDIGEKGSADICVNGGVAVETNEASYCQSHVGRSYKSSDNLLIDDKRDSRGNSSSRQGSSNPLIKSVSCQDLSSEPLQNSFYEMTRSFQADGKSQKFAKSDNTLDNPMMNTAKPFRSQLNVTLKFPRANESKESDRYSPDTPEIPQLPSIDYRLFNNPFLKTFVPLSGIYGNSDAHSPVTRPLSIQVNENKPCERGKRFEQHQQPIDYSTTASLTQSFARRLNPEENTVKSTRGIYESSEVESDQRGVSVSSTTTIQPLIGTIDPRIIASNSKQRQDFQVTSFEAPDPRNLNQPFPAYDFDSLRRLPLPGSASNTLMSNSRKLYQNVPFVPGTPGIFCSPSQNTIRMFYDNQTNKVPAQTQTSIDDESCHGDDDVTAKNTKNQDLMTTDNASAASSSRRKRTVRKERADVKMDKRPLSPAAQRRRLRKQSSIDQDDAAIRPSKIGNKTRQLSPTMTNTTTTTGSEHVEDKNESRSSSSGQDSPRKDSRRVSLYFNSKKRSSIASVRTTRSASVDNNRDNFTIRPCGETLDTTNSERERTNSASSGEAANGKGRKSSISSGKVPWCACWGNGCI